MQLFANLGLPGVSQVCDRKMSKFSTGAERVQSFSRSYANDMQLQLQTADGNK
jgi:hypothetical protein